MILNALFGIFQTFARLTLAPLSVVNFSINSLLGISYVADFIKIVIWILPWNNITPIIDIVIGLLIFRTIVSLLKTIWGVLPIL